MASLAAPALRFDLGRVVERTFASLGRNFAVFSMLALLLAGVPALLTGSLITLAENGGRQLTGDASHLTTFGVTVSGITGLVGAIAAFVLQAAIVYGTIADLNGRRAAFGECLSSGLRNWFSLFLLAIVVTVAEVFGYILLIVPGLIMTVAWIVAAPAQVVERTGVFGAISRSAELTRGRRWPLLGLLVIYLVASGVVRGLVQGVLTAGAIGLSAPASHAATNILVGPLLNVVTGLVGAAGVASIYYELRSTREGVGPEALAAVFD